MAVQMPKPRRTSLGSALSSAFLCLLLVSVARAQFIHIFEVQDENRAPKSDLFDPSQYKYVSPSQLPKQAKLATVKPEPSSMPSNSSPSRSSNVSSRDEMRNTMRSSGYGESERVKLNEIERPGTSNRHQNAYSAAEAAVTRPVVNTTPASVTFMQPISRILPNISTNEIPEQFEAELRKQIRMQQSENRYSRTTPLKVSAQNQRQYVVRVPAPFQAGQASNLPQQQLPPNLSRYQAINQAAQSVATHPNAQSSSRLSTLNSVLSSPGDSGIPSSLLNSFLQRTQGNTPSQSSNEFVPHAQPPYAANLTPAQGPARQSAPQPTVIATAHQSAPTGRSVSGANVNAISLLQPPVTNKESLTDEDIRLIEEHNRKVRLFLQQRQSELAAEQDRLRQQKAAEETAAKAQQEAAARAAAAEQERIRQLRAEQEAAARAAAEQERIRKLREQQEIAARAAAEQERIRRIKAEQEAAARAIAEQERLRKIRAEQEAAAKAAAEQERIQRLRAEQERIRRIREEQEAAARAAAEQERIRKLREQQEIAARAAAEQERIQRIKAEQEAAAKAAAEQERIRKLREEQEMALRAAAEQERYQKYREEQERLQKLKAEQEVLAEHERLKQLRAQQEAAIRLAEAERGRLDRFRAEQEIATLRVRYRGQNIPLSNLSSHGLSYQPETNLAVEDSLGTTRSQTGTEASLVDAARLRAEKEALAEQERLLRFQASQQALAQQQAAEQARLRRLREEEMLRADDERIAREAQARDIMRAREEQNRLIQAARNAATRATPSASYTTYTDEVERLSNYSVPEYRSLNNVRTPEPSYPRSSELTASQSMRPPAITGDYLRRASPPESLNHYSGNHTASALHTSSRISSAATATAPSESTTSPPNFKAAKISLQELPPDLDADGIPGVAGRDYPTLTEIPKTSFSCGRMPLNGYYADTETACQVVHMCQMGGVQDSFLCPNGTIWNQEKFACQWWYEVSCATAPSFYALNNNLYKARGDGKPESDQSTRQV